LKRALARIVERSHLDRRKPVRRFLRFTVAPDFEIRIGTAAAIRVWVQKYEAGA
jgi:hypothetical protein